MTKRNLLAGWLVSVLLAGAGNAQVTKIPTDSAESFFKKVIQRMEEANPGRRDLNQQWCPNSDTVFTVPSYWGPHFSIEVQNDSFFVVTWGDTIIHFPVGLEELRLLVKTSDFSPLAATTVMEIFRTGYFLVSSLNEDETVHEGEIDMVSVDSLQTFERARVLRDSIRLRNVGGGEIHNLFTAAMKDWRMLLTMPGFEGEWITPHVFFPDTAYNFSGYTFLTRGEVAQIANPDTSNVLYLYLTTFDPPQVWKAHYFEQTEVKNQYSVNVFSSDSSRSVRFFDFSKKVATQLVAGANPDTTSLYRLFREAKMLSNEIDTTVDFSELVSVWLNYTWKDSTFFQIHEVEPIYVGWWYILPDSGVAYQFIKVGSDSLLQVVRTPSGYEVNLGTVSPVVVNQNGMLMMQLVLFCGIPESRDRPVKLWSERKNDYLSFYYFPARKNIADLARDLVRTPNSKLIKKVVSKIRETANYGR